MSGITGIYYIDARPVDRADLGRMVDILAHRGPDGANVWKEGSIGLGHRMLCTTPESLLEQLPLVNQTGELVLTADARIDNRDELIAALSLTDRSRDQITDSQLILTAYEKWGESCPERLLGDFAFAIWDGRKQLLFCARDYFGVKPFYYYYQPSRAFIFASEIKALLCVPGVPRRLNKIRVADHLASIVEDQVITFYQGICRLPSGHSLRIDREGSQLQQYWSLDPAREICYVADEEYAEAFREIFTEAVRCRLRSAFPVGCSLSGGLDSSSVVCVARKLLAGNGNHPLHTFSYIFDEVPECDERPFINAVLDQGRVESHYVHADRLSPLADIDRVLWHQDQPFLVHNLFMEWFQYSVAQQQGIRVMLDGEDGDTTVSHGEEYLIELARAGRWVAFSREATALSQHFNIPTSWWLQDYGLTYLTELAHTGQWIALVKQVNEVSKHFRVPRWQLLWNRGLKPLAPEPIRYIWRALRGYNQPARPIGVMNPVFAQRINWAERETALMEAHINPLHTQREQHWLNLTAGIIPYFEEVGDKATAAFSIEQRHPFWDRRLVEFCLAIPPEQKLYQGWPRGVMRRAMTNILPKEVQWRVGKSDLSPNFTRNLLAFEHKLLEEVIVKNPQDIEEYVDISTLRETYYRYVSQPTIDDAEAIWPAVTLAVWRSHTGLTA